MKKILRWLRGKIESFLINRNNLFEDVNVTSKGLEREA